MRFSENRKAPVHWIIRQPSAMIMTFNNGWVEFYLANKNVFEHTSQKLPETGTSLID